MVEDSFPASLTLTPSLMFSMTFANSSSFVLWIFAYVPGVPAVMLILARVMEARAASMSFFVKRTPLEVIATSMPEALVWLMILAMSLWRKGSPSPAYIMDLSPSEPISVRRAFRMAGSREAGWYALQSWPPRG